MAGGYHIGQHRSRSSKCTLKIVSPQIPVSPDSWWVRRWTLTAKGNNGTFGEDGNILYLDYDGDMDIYICQNSSDYPFKMGMFLVC